MTGPAPSQPPPRSTGAVIADAIVAMVLWVPLVLGGGLAMFYAVMYFASSVDGCTGTQPCEARDRAEFAILVLCSGVLGAWVLAAVGTLVCALLRRYVWYWPFIGLLIAGGATWWGVHLAVAAGGL